MYGVPQQLLIQALPDPAPNWLWTLDIGPVGMSSSPSVGDSSTNSFTNSVSNLFSATGSNLQSISNLYVRDVSIPFLNIDVETRFRSGLYYHFPRFATASPVMITFYETIFFDVSYFLSQWHFMVRHPDGNYGLPVEYCANGILTLYDYVGIPQMVITLVGMWPTHRQNWDLHYNNSNEIMVAVEFSVNNVVLSNPLSNSMFGTVGAVASHALNNPLLNSAQGVGGTIKDIRSII